MQLPHRATRRPGNPDTGHVATKAREAIRQSRRDRINGSSGEGDDRNFLSCLVGGKRSPFRLTSEETLVLTVRVVTQAAFGPSMPDKKSDHLREEHMLGRALGGIASDRDEQLLLRGASAGYQAVCLQFRRPYDRQGDLQNLAPVEPPIQIPVGFFVIKHPKGNVLFDTGNNDRIIKDPSYWGASFTALKPVNTPDVAIDTQLGKIDLKPDDIKYVVASHLHLDHGGNVGKFPNSTIVVQKDEIQNAFWPKAGTGGPYMIGDFLPLRAENKDYPNAVKMLQLEGDLDLFGDGTLMVKRWVGHTPGSQMMTVRLKNTGLIILTGDNVYFRENVEKSLPPNIVLAYNPSGILAAYEWIRHVMATEKADFFTAHDPDAFKAMKKAPEFYD